MPGMMYIPPYKRENPMANMGMNFLMQLALSKIAHDRRMEEQDRLLEAKKIEIQEQRKAEEEERKRPKTATELKVGDKLVGHIDEKGVLYYLPKEKEKVENQPASVKEWSFAKEQFIAGQGPNPGSYDVWLKNHNASKAIRIGLDEKINTQEAMKDIDRKSFVQTAAWDNQIVSLAKGKFDKDTWEMMPAWNREKEVFNTADNDIKTVYKDFNPYFGVKDGVQGWYGKNPKSGKFELIKRWGTKPEIEQPRNIPVPPDPNEPGVIRKKF